MSKPIMVGLHGSSHFKESRRSFQSRFQDAWSLFERRYSRKRFFEINIFATGGKKLDDQFATKFRANVKDWQRKGFAQVQVIVLGDNDLREAINNGHACGGFSSAERLKQAVEELVLFASTIPDLFLIVCTPLPCPKYHRYTDVFQVHRILKCLFLLPQLLLLCNCKCKRFGNITKTI
jgi:hypothetical protein